MKIKMPKPPADGERVCFRLTKEAARGLKYAEQYFEREEFLNYLLLGSWQQVRCKLEFMVMDAEEAENIEDGRAADKTGTLPMPQAPGVSEKQATP